MCYLWLWWRGGAVCALWASWPSLSRGRRCSKWCNCCVHPCVLMCGRCRRCGCLYVRMCTCVYAHMCKCLHVRVPHGWVYGWVYVGVECGVWASVCVCSRVHICACVHVRVCVRAACRRAGLSHPLPSGSASRSTMVTIVLASPVCVVQADQVISLS